MTAFEFLIVLLVLILVTISTVFITNHIDRSRLQNQQRIDSAQNLAKPH